MTRSAPRSGLGFRAQLGVLWALLGACDGALRASCLAFEPQARVDAGSSGARAALRDLPPGASCSDHRECASHTCDSSNICAECTWDADCADQQLCVAGACSRCASDADCALAASLDSATP